VEETLAVEEAWPMIIEVIGNFATRMVDDGALRRRRRVPAAPCKTC